MPNLVPVTEKTDVVEYAEQHVLEKYFSSEKLCSSSELRVRNNYPDRLNRKLRELQETENQTSLSLISFGHSLSSDPEKAKAYMKLADEAVSELVKEEKTAVRADRFSFFKNSAFAAGFFSIIAALITAAAMVYVG